MTTDTVQNPGQVVHSIAFGSGGRILTKCGVETTVAHAQAFNPSCPDCLDRENWPSKDEEKQFFLGKRKR